MCYRTASFAQSWNVNPRPMRAGASVSQSMSRYDNSSWQGEIWFDVLGKKEKKKSSWHQKEATEPLLEETPVKMMKLINIIHIIRFHFVNKKKELIARAETTSISVNGMSLGQASLHLLTSGRVAMNWRPPQLIIDAF